jgi:porphyrinogen peroxidase
MLDTLSQPGILAALSPCGRSLVFRLELETDPRRVLRRFCDAFVPESGVVGFGAPLLRFLGAAIPGMRAFPSLAGPACAVPATQQSLWVLLRGPDRGTLFDATMEVQSLLSGAFALEDAMDTFRYRDGRDLTGYLDGTANPEAAQSVATALVAEGVGPGLAGSSFAAVQRWVHDLRRFNAHSAAERDDMIGRSRETNEELAEAPASSHVKRSEQEGYDPPAFMVRRSMPWASAREQGLEFIAYGNSLDPFERVLRRMAGLDDGILDALFTFSRPVTGGYYWCPPIAGGRLDLTALRV